MSFSRGVRLIILSIILGALWGYAYNATKDNWYYHHIVKAFPSYSLICLGCYVLWEIGRGLLFLKDYPEERKSLEEDIARARKFLQEKKVL